jgi:hypothetical protein
VKADWQAEHPEVNLTLVQARVLPPLVQVHFTDMEMVQAMLSFVAVVLVQLAEQP